MDPVRLRREETREAHIWLASVSCLEDPALREAAVALLLPEEHHAWQRFLQPHSRDEYLLTRLLCRRVLSHVAPVPPQAWIFARNKYGRPEIVGPPEQVGLRFNLSNTRDWAACLVVRGVDAGVDVENCSRTPDIEGLSRAVLAPLERAALLALPPAARAARFFSLWTVKEAYIKARGLGLSLGMENICVSLGAPGEPESAPRLRVPAAWNDPEQDWQLHTQVPVEGLLLGVALRRGAAADYKIVVHAGVP